MEKDNRPRGRQKHVGEGSAEVHKREGTAGQIKASDDRAVNAPHKSSERTSKEGRDNSSSGGHHSSHDMDHNPEKHMEGTGNPGDEVDKGLLGAVAGAVGSSILHNAAGNITENILGNAAQNVMGNLVGSNSQHTNAGSGGGGNPPSNGISQLFASGSNNGNSGSSSGRKSSGLIRIILVVLIIFIAYKAITWVLNSGSPSSGSVISQLTNTSNIGSSWGSAPASNQPYGDLNTMVSKDARDKRTVIKGGGRDIVTIMVYMCGTDLEAKYGMGTSDLKEMLSANISDNINLLVETGGATRWNNDVVSNNSNQIYQVTSQGLKILEKDLGKKYMTDPNTLTSFIKYCKSNFPADRYELIFWDHGGGSVSGYGYDQFCPSDSMTLDEINKALKDSDCTFDFVGFDACLMATLETGFAVSPYADYLIASEESEPGTGWYYTDWISLLSRNSSTPTLELGQNIADTFVAASYQSNPNYATTLSVVDLAELDGTVPADFTTFSKSIANSSGNYTELSKARSVAREFAADSRIDQVDLIDLAERIGTREAEALSDTLKSCVKYNRTNAITNANGISIYFPYRNLSNVNNAVSTYQKIGLDTEYTNSIRSFASVMASGQAASYQSNGSMMDNLLGILSGSSSSGSSGGALDGSQMQGLLGSLMSGGGFDFSSILGAGSGKSMPEWFDEKAAKDSEELLTNTQLTADSLSITKKDGKSVISLNEKQWDLVSKVSMSVFLDDGKGYISLGEDNTIEYNDDGDLLVDHDGTWLAFDRQIVSYYVLDEEYPDDERYTVKGYIPALVNKQPVHINVVFSDENPAGVITGATPVYTNGETATVSKGEIPLVKGDKIDFVCDYYSYDGQYDSSYLLGETYELKTDMSDIVLENLKISDLPYSMSYRFTDFYNNTLFTESLTGQTS